MGLGALCNKFATTFSYLLKCDIEISNFNFDLEIFNKQ